MKNYFSHDYNARNDRKLIALQMKHGLEGIGAFWCIIEKLYEEGGILPLDCERIAFELRTHSELIDSVLRNFELFEIVGDSITSHSVSSRLKIQRDKSDKAQKSATAKWEKHYANAERTQSERNAIKEKKKKENKIKGEKEIEKEKVNSALTPSQTMKDFLFMVSENKDQLLQFSQKIALEKRIPIETVRAEIVKFAEYWSELSLGGTKQRWEQERFFEVPRRLGTWFSNIATHPANKPVIIR